MNAVISPSHTEGEIRAISSKSVAHRLLICGAFSDRDTTVRCDDINDDISATVRCLCALGAKIERDGACFKISPVRTVNKNALLDCGESGSTLRFLLPVCASLGADASFLMKGRLSERPLSPLREELEVRGIAFERNENILSVKGQLDNIDISIDGGVSSQFISGLLLAVAVSGKTGRVRVTGNVASKPYINITADALSSFGITVNERDGQYEISKNNGLTPKTATVAEGDWSAAAFPLTVGVIGKGAVTVTDLNLASQQGDKQIITVLENMGARIETGKNSVTAFPSKLRGTRIDGENIPDLIPILAVAAAVAEGTTVVYNASRLRIKESDRLAAISDSLSALGADIKETEDGLEITGRAVLRGGQVSSFGDHRIAMSASVAALRCESEVTVENADAVSKSYPSFFEDMSSLGLTVKKR